MRFRSGLFFISFVLAATNFLLSFAAAAAENGHSDLRAVLRQGAPLTRWINRGERHAVAIRLSRGQFVRLRIDQLRPM